MPTYTKADPKLNARVRALIQAMFVED